MEEKEIRGDLPWPVGPSTMMAKRVCTARNAMSIILSMLVTQVL